MILPKPFFRDFFTEYKAILTGEISRALRKQAYLKENENIRRLLPKEKLLEYNVEEGWATLCKLIGMNNPDEPFPGRNYTAEYNALMEFLHNTRNPSEAIGKVWLAFLERGSLS